MLDKKFVDEYKKNKGVSDDKEEAAAEEAETEEQHLHGFGVFADLVEKTCANRFPNDDADCSREAVHGDVHHGIGRVGKAGRGNDTLGESSENDAVAHEVCTPDQLTCHDGHSVADKVSKQLPIHA